MKSYILPLDGDTWMVSVLHADCEDGSTWYSDRGGKTPLEAAEGYMSDDPSDNPGVRLMNEHPDTGFLCVIGQQVGPGGKQWKVYLFVVEDGKVKSFP